MPQKITKEELDKQLLNQIWVNSRIVCKKYYAAAISINLFVALVFASAIFLLVVSYA